MVKSCCKGDFRKYSFLAGGWTCFWAPRCLFFSCKSYWRNNLFLERCTFKKMVRNMKCNKKNSMMFLKYVLSRCRLAVIPMKMWQFSRWTLSGNCPWNFWRRGSWPTSDSRKTFCGLLSTSWKRTGKRQVVNISVSECLCYHCHVNL